MLSKITDMVKRKGKNGNGHLTDFPEPLPEDVLEGIGGEEETHSTESMEYLDPEGTESSYATKGLVERVRGLPRRSLVLVGVLIACAAYGGYTYWGEQGTLTLGSPITISHPEPTVSVAPRPASELKPAAPVEGTQGQSKSPPVETNEPNGQFKPDKPLNSGPLDTPATPPPVVPPEPTAPSVPPSVSEGHKSTEPERIASAYNALEGGKRLYDLEQQVQIKELELKLERLNADIEKARKDKVAILAPLPPPPVPVSAAPKISDRERELEQLLAENVGLGGSGGGGGGGASSSAGGGGGPRRPSVSAISDFGAVINGEMVRPGGSVAGYRVVSINAARGTVKLSSRLYGTIEIGM